MPADVLPYYLAIAPAPSDLRVAFAVAKRPLEDACVRVGVFIEDTDTCVELFNFSSFAPVLIAWSACGNKLAFAQGSTLMTRDAEGALRLVPLQNDIKAVGFDNLGRLWWHAGDHLEAAIDGESAATFDCLALTVGGVAAFARREFGGLNIYVFDSGEARSVGRVEEEFQTIRLSIAGHYLTVTLISESIMDRIRVRVIRFDLANTQCAKMLDREVPSGFNAGPGMEVVVSENGDVFAAYEDGDCTRIWSLSHARPPQPVSPDEFEVFDFALHRHGDRLAVIASDTRSSGGGFDRQLLIGRVEGGVWQFLPAIAGVHDMPRWRSDERLEILQGDAGRWVKSTLDPDLPEALPRIPFLISSLGSGATELDLLSMPGGGHPRQSGIILLPRLHQQFVAGAQSFFFHHLLFSIARALALNGHTVVTLCGPGAIGRGRRRREPAGSYIAVLRAALADVAGVLRDRGCKSVSLLAGSLAAVPALRLLGRETQFTAGAFVAPLFEASIRVTNPVKRHLLDDPLIQSIDSAAADVTVPLLVIHGGRDQVAPLSQVTRLCRGITEKSLIETCIFNDEGHIFTKPCVWEEAESRIQDFFARIAQQ